MWIRLLTIALMTITIGCQPHPRFRTGGEERPALDKPRRPVRLTTNDSLRLGVIMQSFLGKPYAGRSPSETGVDCSHFVLKVFKKFDGRDLPRTVARQYRIGTPAHRRQLLYGDLVFFRTDSRPVSHVGIYIGYGEFIHASTSQGVIISKLKEKYWSERYVDARRILEYPARDSK